MTLSERVARWVCDKTFDLAAFEDASGLLRRPDVRRLLAPDYLVVDIEDYTPGPADRPVAVLLKSGQRPVPELLRPDVLRERLDFYPFFGSLHAATLAELEPPWLDQLYARAGEADRRSWSARVWTSDQTLQELLRVLLGFDPSLVRSDTEMWEWLFRVHYLHADPPAPLLRAALARRPLPAVLPFLPFVQREWEGFVTSNDRTRSPSGVPFPERRVAVYLDGLFTEGLLRPVEANLPASSPRWLLAGTKRLSLEEQARRFATEHALQEYPGAGDGYGRWFDALPQICQAVGAAQLADLPPRADHQAEFELWLRGSYASLTAASHRPLMTHHVIGRVLTDAAESRRTLLVVVDGLRMDQWLWALQAHPQSWSDIAHTQALIAWVPTVTSLARQAIFAGKPPAAFADHWSTTAHEEAHFRGHFEGVHAQYFKQGSRPLVDFLREVRQDARAAHLAVVVNAVDDLVHASAGDIGELHRDVIRLLGDRLLPWLGEWLGLGYTVHLTSDHGHAVATARVRRDAQLKVFGGTQAQRALIIEDPSSMALELALRPDGTELWQSTGLPPGLRFVLASHSHHFAPHGGPLVAHGGCSLEEVVVPYARIGG